MNPKLTANYSEALAALIQANDAPIDGIEVGPWFTPQRIRDIQREFLTWPLQFHASSLVARHPYRDRTLDRLHEYHACTQSKWISLHIEILPLYVYFLSSRFGLHLPPPDIEKAKSKFIDMVLRVKKAMELPVILENLASLPKAKYAFAATPSMLRDLVEKTDSGFLLDIAHARIAASYQQKDIERYLEELPLERTRQIHVSGPREKDGFLRDAHEEMQDEDYALLRWVLERCQPEVVTLEYFRERESLRRQLLKIRAVMAG